MSRAITSCQHCHATERVVAIPVCCRRSGERRDMPLCERCRRIGDRTWRRRWRPTTEGGK
jgi:hypothetical protein